MASLPEITAPKKERTPTVPPKVKVALEALFDDPKADLAAAAAAGGITTYRLREAMKLPHVRRWIWHEKRALIDALCAGNPAALKDIRDNSENSMARVAAIKTAEAIRAEAEETTNRNGERQSPGITIIIEGANGAPERRIGPPAMPFIEARPLVEAGPDNG